MPTDIIEMFWGCTISTCRTENKGRFKTCQGCGKPRTEDSPEWMPGDVSPMAAVTDSKLLSKFKAGADWKCRFCESSQFRADGNCAQCGSEQAKTTGNIKDKACRGELTKDDIERMLKGHKDKLPEEADPFPQEPSAFIPDTGGYRDAPQRAPVRSTPPPTTLDEPLPPIPRFKPSRGTVFGVAGAVLVALILFLVFRTKVVTATVSSVSWNRTVSVARYQVYGHEGWDPSGGAFDVRDEGRRVHHYDHVLVGHHRESYQESYICGETCTTIRGTCTTTPRNCTSNKNGSATCTGGDRVCSPDTKSCSPKTCTRTAYRTIDDYEDQARYQNWYSWKAWEWGHNRDVRVGDSTTSTYWPSDKQIRLNVGLAPGEQERESGRSEHYEVVMLGDGDRYPYSPRSDEEFKRFSVGGTHRIKVGVAHGVEILPR